VEEDDIALVGIELAPSFVGYIEFTEDTSPVEEEGLCAMVFLCGADGVGGFWSGGAGVGGLLEFGLGGFEGCGTGFQRVKTGEV
jgi:hypothetical protein